MALQIKNDSATFGPLSGTGPNTTNMTVTMPASVAQATAILTGFIVEYIQGHERPMGQLEVHVEVTGPISGANVPVRITFGLRDSSSTWDDPYEGTIFFAVIGE